MKSKTIVFFGNERLATGVNTDAPILRSLIDAGYQVAAVVTANRAVIANSRKARPLEVIDIAQSMGIPTMSFNDLKDSVSLLSGYNADVAVLAAFGRIIPQSIIDIFPYGIINIHPSLLPKHRGPIPIEAPILNGEMTTGISLMQLVAAMDAGPVYDQVEYKLNGQETKPSLARELAILGAQQLIDNLPAILNKKLKPQPQNEELARYDQKILATNGIMDFTKPAITLEREVRAYLGWPRSKMTIDNQTIIITQAHVTAGQSEPSKITTLDQQLIIGTSDRLLAIDRLIPAGGREMAVADYLRGNRKLN